MDIHKNARLTPRSREALVRCVVEQGVCFRQAAFLFQVTPKTAAKWVRRFQQQGLAALQDLSSRPRRSPRLTSSSLIERVIQFRRQHTPGYQIARLTGLSPATISRILQRARLSRWRDLEPKPPVVRYERAQPGELIHLDIKSLPSYQEVLLRADGRRRGPRRRQSLGSLALHVAVDDHSRLAFTKLMPDQQACHAIDFLQQAIAFYATHGIRIRALLTDNGSCYRSAHFRNHCQRLGIQHVFTRPYTPRTNGKAERFIQTLMREWVYAKHWTNSQERDQHLAPWTAYYNYVRPHGSLNYNPPISRSDPGTTS
jgi:transposase InsO family protein